MSQPKRRYVGVTYKTNEPHIRCTVLVDAASFDEAWDYVASTKPCDYSILWLQPQWLRGAVRPTRQVREALSALTVGR